MRSIYAIPLAITAVLLIGVGLHFLSDALLPVIAALFLANIFMPLVDFLRKKKVPMIFAILLVLVLVGCVLFGVSVVISESISSVIDVLPKYQEKWEKVFMPALSNLMGKISPALKNKVLNFDLQTAFNSSQIASVLTSFTNSLMSVLSGFLLIMLFMLFILAGNGQFRTKLRRAFPTSSSTRLTEIFDNIDKRVRSYLVNTLLFNLTGGLVMWAVLSIFGVDLAILWGVLSFLLTFIPSIGSIFAAIMPITVAFLQFDDIGTPIAVAATVLLTQLSIGSVIAPRIMGSRLNLSPLLILVSLIFWGWVWGPWGMILSVPITSAIAIIFDYIPSLQPLAVLMSSDPGTSQKAATSETKSS